MRTFNLRLILWLAGIFVVAAVSIHFVHSYQVRKNSGAYLEMARKSKDTVKQMLAEQQGNQKQFEAAAKQTIIYYNRYLGLQQDDDLDVRIEYATFLLEDIRDFRSAYSQNERILRETVDASDSDLLAKQEKVRENQIELAGLFKQYTDGVYHLEQLLETRENDPKLLERIALFQLQMEETSANSEAVRNSLKLAIEHAPDQLSAYARLAAVERERFENRLTAEEVINKMVSENPGNAQAYVLRALFKLADKDPSSQARSIQRTMLETEAIPDCEKALELEPNNLDALNVLSVCSEKLGPLLDTLEEQTAAHTKALTLLKQVIQLKPDIPQLYLRWANLELTAGGRSIDDFRRQRAAAVQAIRQGVAAVEAPQNFDLRWRLADLLMGDDERQEEVDGLIKQLRTEQPENPRVAYLDARKLMVQQQWLASAKVFEEHRDELPNLANRVDMMLASCYEQLGNPDLRLAVARQAVQRNSNDVDARINLAEALVSLNRLSEAIKEYEAIVKMRNSVSAYKRYATLLLSANYRQSPEDRNWESVNRVIDGVEKIGKDDESITEVDPWVPTMRANVAMASDKAEAAEEAAGILEAAREKDPNQLQFYSALVDLALQQQDQDKAQQQYDKLEAQFGDTLEVRNVKARLVASRARLLDDEKKQEEIAKLSELTKDLDQFKEPDQLQFYWQLARVCLSAGAYDEGLRYGQEAARLTPNNLRLRLFMLDIARVTGNIAVASQLAAEMKDIESGGKEGVVGAVSTYAAAVVDVTVFTNAVAEAAKADKENNDEEGTRAKKASTDNAQFLADAQKKLLQAVKLRPGWSEIPVMQGMIAGYQGQPDVATSYFRQAIDLGDRNPTVVYQVVQSLAREASESRENSEQKRLEADAIIRKLQERRASLPLQLGRLASEINFRRQDFDRALDLARPLASTGEISDQLWIGLVATANGEYDVAETSLEKATEQAPEDPRAWIALVRCLVFAANRLALDNKIDEAAAAKQKAEAAAAKQKAEDALARALTNIKPELRAETEAECLSMMGKWDEAIAMYRKAIDVENPSPALLESAAQFFVGVPTSHGEAKEVHTTAIAILERFIGGDLADEGTAPTKQWARRDLARLLGPRDYRSWRRAVELLGENLAEDPDSIRDKKLRAKLLAMSGVTKADQNAALKDLLELAGKPDGLDPEGRFMLAQRYLAQGRWDEYRSEMTVLLGESETAARLPTYINHYVEALLQHGEVAMARGIASTFRRKASQEIFSTLLVARTLAAGVRPQADQSLRIVIQAVDDLNVKPENKPDKMQQALVGLQGIVDQLKARLAEFENRKSGGGDAGTGAKKNNAPELARLEELVKAQIPPIELTIEKYYKAIVKEAPDRQLIVVPDMIKKAKIEAAVELVQENRTDAPAALLAFACAAILGADDLSTLDRAVVESSREAIEKVLKDAVKQYEDKDEVLPLRNALATHYVDRDQYDQAIEQYEKIMERSQRSFVVLNNLSMLMAAKAENLPKALEYINTAVDLVGPQPLIMDSRVMVLLASNKPKEALAAMLDVIAERPDGLSAASNPALAKRWGGYYFHLALAYQANGDEAKCEVAMKQADKLGFKRDDVFKPELEKYQELAAKYLDLKAGE